MENIERAIESVCEDMCKYGITAVQHNIMAEAVLKLSLANIFMTKNEDVAEDEEDQDKEKVEEAEGDENPLQELSSIMLKQAELERDVFIKYIKKLKEIMWMPEAEK